LYETWCCILTSKHAVPYDNTTKAMTANGIQMARMRFLSLLRCYLGLLGLFDVTPLIEEGLA
jgi:hypothetical protein